MDHGQIFVLALVAIVMGTQVMRVAIMAKHGIPLHDRNRRRAMRRPRHPFAFMAHGWNNREEDQDDESPAAQRKIELLSTENERLTGQIGRLEERLRVLERIATDPAERTAREIDALRDAD
ncbi:MAG TPA: hypothetical protein VFT56_00040 [Sphingomonas sp.]|nr:hypothetical protein [Sphingomonas sp.]